MSLPTISAVITTFNRKEWLAETIEGVLNQSLPPEEVIVVDDGSWDGTEELVKQYPIQYIYQNNKGISAARNLGLSVIQGDYVAFCDSDDLWGKDKLRQQIHHLTSHPDCLMNYTDEIWIRNGVRVNPKKRHRKVYGDIYRSSLDLCLVSPSSALIKKTLLADMGGFDETLPACEDYDLWLRIASTYQVCFIDEKLIVKRGGHADQLSRKYWGMDRFRAKTLVKLILSGQLTAEQRRWTEKKLQEKCEILAKGCIRRNRKGEGKYFHTLPSSLNLQEKYHC